MEPSQLIDLTAEIVAAHVANNKVAIGDVAGLVSQVHTALAALGSPAPAPQEEARPKPAVSVRASIKPGYLVCLACGRKHKTIKRHIATAHGMTPQQYRAEYELPDSYPMVAPEYAQARREMAHRIGLGRKGRGAAGTAKPGSSSAPAGRRRRTKAAK